MTTIGYATLQIIPSLRGVSEAIDRQLAGVSGQGRAAGRVLGENIAVGVGTSRSNVMGKVVTERDASDHGARVGRAFGLALGGAASAGIAGIGYTLTKGFQRLESIDQATFKLKALGHSAAETKTIMDNATASVKGTAFSLADAATAAASAVAAGIKPGQDLTKYLTEVGDAAGIAGTGFDEMGHIFNKVQTQNKAFTDDLQMLSDRGVPIFQWLQEAYGVTGDALSKMVQKGDVDAAHFQQAIETHIGGAAKNMGQSFQGSVDNMETAIARLGAHFLGSIFGDKDGSQLAGPTEAIAKLTEKFDQIDAWVVAHGPEIHQFFATMAANVKAVAGPLGDLTGLLVRHPGLVQAAAEAYLVFKSAQVLGSISTLMGAIGTGTGPGATGLVGGVFTLAAALGVNLGFTIFDKMKQGAREAQAAIDETNRKLHEQFPGVPVTPTGVPAQTGSTAPNNPLNPNNIYDPVIRPPGRATGGAIFGAGTATSDSIPALLSNGEHVLTAKDVAAMGGQTGVYALRQALHRQGGGSIFPMAILDAPRDPRRNADRGRSSQFPDRGPEGQIWYKGPFNYGGDRPGMSLWPGGEGSSGSTPPSWWWPTDKGLIHWPSEPKNALDPWIWNRKGVAGLGAGLGFAGGGAVSPDVQAAGALVGTAYSQAKRTDCSGMVARVIARTLGIPEVGLMSTKNAKEWLAARGFKSGLGGPGQISVGWYDHGPNPNDGHMAMTLSDGSNAEAGGGVGDIFQIGGGAAGASNPEFDQHMYLPTVYGEGQAGSGSAPSSSPFAGGSAAAAMTGGGGSPVVDSGSGTGSGGGSSSSGGGRGLPSSIPDLAALPFNALGDFASGQVSSLLGVLGVNGSPGWLQGVSKLIGGIKVSDSSGNSIFDGGNMFGSAAPIAANPTGTGTLPPDDSGNMHGGRAGQQPGPVYNITARDTEDAFIKAQRLEREKAAAKLSRF